VFAGAKSRIFLAKIAKKKPKNANKITPFALRAHFRRLKRRTGREFRIMQRENLMLKI